MEKVTKENWEFLTTFLPLGWEEKAKQLNALTRKRNFKSPSELLRILMIHLSDGCSMRETVARAKQGGLVSVSDVALLKKLRASSEWFRWMSMELTKKRGLDIKPPDWLTEYTVKSVDASNVSEPGSTGTDWRLHYSMDLFGLQCDQFIISRQETGESFTNFNVHEGDLFIGDRAYGRLKGLKYIVNEGGHFIARLKNKAFKILDKNLKEITLLSIMKDLKIGEIRDITVFADVKNKSSFKMRLCAIRKSDKEAQKAMDRARKGQKKRQRKINLETIELHRYIILVTSLPIGADGARILELYRIRWQIEIAFKRLKSILGLGHLPKKDETSCRAWLHGKLFVALLAQTIIDEGRFFSPWGYPVLHN